MIGSVVDGKYDFVRLLGQGAMGAVYEAHERPSGRPVAVKVMSTEEVSDTLLARFQREADIAAKLRSPHIVEIFGSGRDASGRPYMVMELLAGTTVQQRLKELGPLPPEVAVRIGVQACLGVERAHADGVLHRDLKPANLFLSEQGGELRVKVLDFGVAKLKMDRAAEDPQTLTRTGSLLGSPQFMSPEQARGMKSVDHRSDVWSLGVVMYHLLTGGSPYRDIDALGELIISICSDEPEPLRARAPWVPPLLERAVHAALKLAPDDRYPSVRQMRGALLQCLADPNDTKLTEAMLARLDDAAKRARPADVDEGQLATVALDPGAAPPAKPPPKADPPAPPRPPAAAKVPAVAAAPAPPVAPPPSKARPAHGIGLTIAVVALGVAIGAAAIYAFQQRAVRAPASQTAPR